MNNEEWNPGKLFQTSGSYWGACTLHAGVKLDLFTVIGGETMSGKEIAGKIDGDVDGVTRLLDALSAMGLVRKEDGRYANTGASLNYLSKNSPDYVGYMIMHQHYLVESWFKLAESVKTGSSVRDSMTNDEDERRGYFLMGMFNQAMTTAPGLAEMIDLSGRRSLLDLGGGPGTYAIHFCLANPELKATILDLPTTWPFAEKTVEKFGLSDRIEFHAGDAVTDPIEGEYDVVWISHLLHSEGPDACQEILNKACAVSRPGGIILIHEFILNETMDGPLFPAIFSLNMLLGPPDGRSYSEGQLTRMLESAGAEQVERLDFVGPTESGILKGTVAG